MKGGLDSGPFLTNVVILGPVAIDLLLDHCLVDIGTRRIFRRRRAMVLQLCNVKPALDTILALHPQSHI